MKFFYSLFVLFCLSASAVAQKPLSQRLLDVNDPGYNDALSELQDADIKIKTQTSKDLVQILKSDKNQEFRANAASALGDVCGDVKENITPLIEVGLKDKSKFVRQGSVSALKRCGFTDPRVLTALRAMSKDADKTIQVMVEDLPKAQ